MKRDLRTPQLTRDVSWPPQALREPSPPRLPVVWTPRDVAGGIAFVLTAGAALAVSWRGLAHPWPIGVGGLWIVLVGGASGLLARVAFAVVARRPLLDPFGRAKPGWVRRITVVHVVYFAGAAAFSFIAASAGSGWLWPCGLFWVAMTVWRVCAGLRAHR